MGRPHFVKILVFLLATTSATMECQASSRAANAADGAAVGGAAPTPPWQMDPDPIPDPRNQRGSPVTQQAINRDLRAIAEQSGVAITAENPRFEVFQFPRNNGKRAEDLVYEGETFTEWTGLYRYFDHMDDLDENAQTKYAWIDEHLFDGSRAALEEALGESWEDRKRKDFAPIPDTAEWSLQMVKGTLMPILQDDSSVYLVAPTSAECASRQRKLAMPTPWEGRPYAAGAGDYMNHDVWFEDCGDGGAYVIGLPGGETVLVFYLDGPGDMIMNRWRCSKDQWETMWVRAFGSTVVELDDGSNEEAAV